MVRNQPHIHARSLGRRALKNVESSLEVFAIDAAGRPEPSVWWKRPAGRVVAGLVLTAALAYAIYLPNRTAVLASVALNLPKLVGPSIEQKLGFATTSDGVRIAYATTGQGPPLVFVLGWATHLQDGLGSPFYDGSGVIVRLSEHHTFVRYDGRGFGMSDREVTDFSLDARVRDLESVVDALGFSRFAVFAVSAGGPAAIAYAARHPERVSALILAGTFAGRHWWRRSPEETRAVENIGATFRTAWPSPAVRAMLVELIAPEADEVTKRVLIEFLGRSGDGPTVAGFLEEQDFRIDVREDARRLRLPTLVIHGTRDAPVPIEMGRELASLIRGARFEVLQGAGHLEDTNSPRVFDLIDGFLREQGADAAAGG
jgi:pimeloyl-ACP methyl ester carboxylesterase